MADETSNVIMTDYTGHRGKEYGKTSRSLIPIIPLRDNVFVRADFELTGFTLPVLKSIKGNELPEFVRTENPVRRIVVGVGSDVPDLELGMDVRIGYHSIMDRLFIDGIFEDKNELNAMKEFEANEFAKLRLQAYSMENHRNLDKQVYTVSIYYQMQYNGITGIIKK